MMERSGNAQKSKKPSFSYMLLRGALIHNPVLVQIVGLCPVLAASGDLKTALLLSAISMLTLVITQAVACLFLKTLPRFLRICIYLLLGIAIILPLTSLLNRLDSTLLLGAGMYLPLLAVNSVTALHCEKFAVQSSTTLRLALYDAFATGLGFGAVFTVVGILRELLGSGSLWGKEIPHVPALSAFRSPFGSFLILALLAAVLQAFTGRYFSEHAADAALKISKTEIFFRRSAAQSAPDNKEEKVMPTFTPLREDFPADSHAPPPEAPKERKEVPELSPEIAAEFLPINEARENTLEQKAQKQTREAEERAGQEAQAEESAGQEAQSDPAMDAREIQERFQQIMQELERLSSEQANADE